MARDFDDFPVYDAVIRLDTRKLSNVWLDFIATFVETLQEYLSQNGIFVPRLTTEQRDAIQDAVNGQMIYNTTLNKFQGFENGAWTNLI